MVTGRNGGDAAEPGNCGRSVSRGGGAEAQLPKGVVAGGEYRAVVEKDEGVLAARRDGEDARNAGNESRDR